MYLNIAVVTYRPKLTKTSHKKADPGSGGADHFREYLLRHGRNRGRGLAEFSEFRHNQKNPRQTLLAGVEKLVDKVGLGSQAAGRQESEEYVRE